MVGVGYFFAPSYVYTDRAGVQRKGSLTDSGVPVIVRRRGEGGGLMTDGCTARDWENVVNVTNFSSILVEHNNNQQSKWDRIRSKQILQK